MYECEHPVVPVLDGDVESVLWLLLSNLTYSCSVRDRVEFECIDRPSRMQLLFAVVVFQLAGDSELVRRTMRTKTKVTDCR